MVLRKSFARDNILKDFAYNASEKYKEGKSVVEKAYIVKKTRTIESISECSDKEGSDKEWEDCNRLLPFRQLNLTI